MVRVLLPFLVEHGLHCSSSAWRSVIKFQCGVALSEAMVWGAGSALFFLVHDPDSLDDDGRDRFFAYGWTGAFDDDLAAHLQLDMVTEVDAADEDAWRAVRSRVADGIPVIVTGDIYYLWYKERIHFANHRFVVAGFDDERREAMVLERTHPAPLAVPLADLAKSMHPPPPTINPTNFFTYLRSGRITADPRAATCQGLRVAAERMLSGHVTTDLLRAAVEAGILLVGLPGLATFRQRVARWRTALPADHQLRRRTLHFAQLIYANGSGGAFFRNTLVALLIELRAPPAWTAQARAIAAVWTALASALVAVAEHPSPRHADALWQDIDFLLGRCHDLERDLYVELAASTESDFGAATSARL